MTFLSVAPCVKQTHGLALVAGLQCFNEVGDDF